MVGASGAYVFPIHFVDNNDARQIALFGFSPDNFGANFDAGDGLNQDDCPFGHGQCGVHFTDEVSITGRIHHIHFGIFPLDGGQGCGDGTAAVDFFFFKIHSGCTALYVSHAGGDPGVEEHALYEGCFTCPVVGDKGNVADLSSLVLFHSLKTSWNWYHL